MIQTERRTYLIKKLIAEQPQYQELSVPEDTEGQKRLLRSLINVRFPSRSAKTSLRYRTNIFRKNWAKRV